MFDDLFDKFFGRNRKIKKEEPKSPINSDFVDKLMKSIKNMENFDENFGPPTKVEYFENDGVYYKRDIWEIDGGEMVHLVGSTEPFQKEPIVLTYDEQLEIALNNENYEEAAILRDKIKLINK